MFLSDPDRRIRNPELRILILIRRANYKVGPGQILIRILPEHFCYQIQ
jgi:hypothetical protein